jgi:hypothetical protein
MLKTKEGLEIVIVKKMSENTGSDNAKAALKKAGLRCLLLEEHSILPDETIYEIRKAVNWRYMLEDSSGRPLVGGDDLFVGSVHRCVDGNFELHVGLGVVGVRDKPHKPVFKAQPNQISSDCGTSRAARRKGRTWDYDETFTAARKQGAKVSKP